MDRPAADDADPPDGRHPPRPRIYPDPDTFRPERFLEAPTRALLVAALRRRRPALSRREPRAPGDARHPRHDPSRGRPGSGAAGGRGPKVHGITVGRSAAAASASPDAAKAVRISRRERPHRAPAGGRGLPAGKPEDDIAVACSTARCGSSSSSASPSSVEDVAKRAKVARVTVYRRFAGKDALVEAVILRELRRFQADLAGAVAASTSRRTSSSKGSPSPSAPSATTSSCSACWTASPTSCCRTSPRTARPSWRSAGPPRRTHGDRTRRWSHVRGDARCSGRRRSSDHQLPHHARIADRLRRPRCRPRVRAHVPRPDPPS